MVQEGALTALASVADSAQVYLEHICFMNVLLFFRLMMYRPLVLYERRSGHFVVLY